MNDAVHIQVEVVELDAVRIRFARVDRNFDFFVRARIFDGKAEILDAVR